MNRVLRDRASSLAALSAANALALVGGLASTMAVLRLLDHVEFAAWAVALSLQALVSVLPQATGPGCARWLAMDPGASEGCRRIRSRAGWIGGSLLLLVGSTAWSLDPGPVTPWAWLLLGLQVPATAAEAHRTQSLQMARRFRAQAAFLPLSRLSKAALLWGAVATGHLGIEMVALLQLVAMIPAIVPWERLTAAGSPATPGSEFARLWRGNLASGAIVWSGTRSTVLALDARSPPESTAAYGVADTLCTSMQLPLQALGSLLQPSLYGWTPQQGRATLLRGVLASLALGCGLLVVALVGGPPLLGLLAGERGSDSIECLNILGIGILATSLALVPGTLLQRHGAGTTIAGLEAAAAATSLAGLLLLPALGAKEAALCWTAGRWVWAVGSSLAAWHRTREAMSPKD